MKEILPMDKHVTTEEILKIFQADDICYDTEGSEIAKFYAGKSVFLTGGSGFLGKLLVEKLLRACPDITCIFLLIRTKKGKDPHTRVDEIYADPMFEKLAKQQPKFRHKIVLVTGDVALPGLGMSIEDRKMVTDKASVIIHSAATVKFHEKLNLAVDINVKGTKEMITLAKECKHIDSFVHISTAFTHCYRNDVGEKMYDVPYDIEKITQICNATPPHILDKITPDLLGEWPNTYVFTKAIAEDCIRKYSSPMPTCIVRPAIVIPTYKEPLKSWIDNIYGATGIVLGSGIGVVRVAYINKYKHAEIVPADMVVNCIIAASYKTAMEKKTNVSVYNYAASKQNRVSWNDFMALTSYFGLKTPSLKGVWVYSLRLLQNRYAYDVCTFFLHTIPALLIDLGLLVVGKKPQMLNIYKKIHRFNDIIGYFAHKDWNFNMDNTQSLYENLTPVDKDLYFFDMRQFNWRDYCMTYCLGVRTYLIKDDVSTIEQAKKRYFKMQIVDTLLKLVVVVIFLRILYILFNYVFQ